MLVGSCFGRVAHCFEFLTHLWLSCVLVDDFCDFESIFRSFGEGLGRILGRFSMISGDFFEKR